MNTVASQVTVFTDDSVEHRGPDRGRAQPVRVGRAWPRARARSGVARRRGARRGAARSARTPTPPAPSTAATCADSFQRVVAGAPAHVTVQVHRSRAVALRRPTGVPGGPQSVRLEDGTRLTGLDAVVLAQGHVPARPDRARGANGRVCARIHGLTYIAAGQPGRRRPGGRRARRAGAAARPRA